MKLKQYIENLQKIYDEVGDLPLIHASDYLANDYFPVVGGPSHGYYNDSRDNPCLDEYQIVRKVEETDEHVVCINWG